MTQSNGLSAPSAEKTHHRLSNVEWWYAYAFLTGSSGSRYAVMASFFRVGELAVPKGHYFIHSLTQLDRNIHECHSELDRTLAGQMTAIYLPAYLLSHPRDKHTWTEYKSLMSGQAPKPHLLLKQAAVLSRPVRLSYGGSDLAFDDAVSMRFSMGLVSPSARIRLRFEPVKPVSIIDEKGELNGLRYHSVTRNLVRGELQTAGRTEMLEGEGWFDHQWGRSYGLLRGDGWDWLGLQLEDGRDLLVSRLRSSNSAQPPLLAARLIDLDGQVESSDSVLLTPTGSWKSPATSIRYPLGWDLVLKDFGLILTVKPTCLEQEMRIVGPLRAIWEGAVEVSGSSTTDSGVMRPVEGRGFAELVGYHRSGSGETENIGDTPSQTYFSNDASSGTGSPRF